MRKALATIALLYVLPACGNYVDGYYAPGSDTQTGTDNDGNGSVVSNRSVLTVADYNDGSTTRDALGGEIACDHCTVGNNAGVLTFTYKPSGTYLGLSNAMRASWCEYSVVAYDTLAFDLGASSAGNKVDILVHVGDGTCPSEPRSVALGTVTLTTAMQHFTMPLSGIDRENVISVEMDPQTVDATVYSLDNVAFTAP